MFSRVPHLACAATPLLLAAALFAPSATAGYHRPGTPSRVGSRHATPCHQYCGVARRQSPKLSAPVIVRFERAARGFQWSDAAIGFGVGCGAMMLGAGALLARRRARLVATNTAG
jgi:hypothetical protein